MFSTAHKLVDYFSYGQSVFKSSSPGVKDISKKFGISGSTHLEQFLHLYFHFKVINLQDK